MKTYPKLFCMLDQRNRNTLFHVNEQHSDERGLSIDTFRDGEWTEWGFMLPADLDRKIREIDGDYIDGCCLLCGETITMLGTQVHTCRPDDLRHAQLNARRWSCCCHSCTVRFIKQDREDALAALPCAGCGTPGLDCRCDADEHESC